MASAQALHILVKTREVHGPVKTAFGWHLIKTLSRD
ncbi:peptidyl-prolyl cis-trans isomerase [Idiomarina tyrosinivorans]|nr:peptidyl-prolyl cis-trans isomerase [Idiomarina tyrosinivorans]